MDEKQHRPQVMKMNEMEKEIRRIRVSLSRLNKLLKEPIFTYIDAAQAASQNTSYTDLYADLITGAVGHIKEIYVERTEEIQREIENIRWHLKQLSTLAKSREEEKNI